jgi:hypothetical protein
MFFSIESVTTHLLFSGILIKIGGNVVFVISKDCVLQPGSNR